VATTNHPHRIIVQRVPYRHDPQIVAPVGVERFGLDAEGRVVFVDPARAASRRHVYLPAAEPTLVAYVREDPPSGYSLLDAVGAAFDAPLPRPDALALLGLLISHHVVLADGTRLGADRERLATLIARISLEPDGFTQQVSRVPDWALAEALRPRLETLRARLVSTPWVRDLGRPELGFVRSVGRHEVLVGRTSQEPIDVGDRLIIGSPSDGRPPVLVRVTALDQRDVRVGQFDGSRDEGVSSGDPVEFQAVEARPDDRSS
jgi:hypothetical protein